MGMLRSITMLALLFAGLTTMAAADLKPADELKSADEDKTGLAVGEKAPGFTLADQSGAERSLEDLLKAGPVALVFTRSASGDPSASGSWSSCRPIRRNSARRACRSSPSAMIPSTRSGVSPRPDPSRSPCSPTREAGRSTPMASAIARFRPVHASKGFPTRARSCRKRRPDQGQALS
jgi:hypothetical protein